MLRADPVPGEPSTALPVLFLHIPRTGGSTIKFMLQSAYGLDRSLLDAHLFKTAGENLASLGFVEGHVTAGFLAQNFGPGWRSNTLTMLRDPVDRVVSQARHIRRRPGRFREVLLREVKDPDSVFERVPRLIDLQTKQLSRTPIDAADVSAEALEEAKANLETIAFGLTEAFDASMALFAERFGFRVPRFDVANPASGRRDQDLLTDEFRSAAVGHNRMDALLYAHAQSLLRRRLDSFTADILEMPAGDADVEFRLRYDGHPVEDCLRVPPGGGPGRISGWVLIDGRAADAVVVRYGDDTVPLVVGVARDDAARMTRDLDNRYAGILGTLFLGPDARSIDIVAIDRVRGLRGERRIEVVHSPHRSILARSIRAAAAKSGPYRRRPTGDTIG